MTEKQLLDLVRIMGGPVHLLRYRNTVTDPECLRAALSEADAVAAVLPPELLAQLLKLAGEKPVLQSVAVRTLTGKMVLSAAGKPEPEYAFEHYAWERVLKVEICTQRL